ncbi:MAG: tRNA (adenosine(37)-N6)-dimethylallyltransferase MiaA [Chloroflexota bacterium]
MERYPRIVAVVGPTAVGKSGLALQLAPEIGAEIVSADSRQIYRYMDIGTAKATLAEQAAVRHYLIDLVEPDDTYSQERYGQEGTRVLLRLGALGRVALVVGGTGFYLRGLLDRPRLPRVSPNETLRSELRDEAGRLGSETLHDRLASIDPESAARIHPRNLPRLIRALEIIDASGEPVPPAPLNPLSALYLGISREPAELRQIADRRVETQVRQGLVEETRVLLEMGYGPDLPAMQGFGYRHMVGYLEGRDTLAEAIDQYKQSTRQYIRRQMTWFRADPRVIWLQAGPDAERSALQRIEPFLRDGLPT